MAAKMSIDELRSLSKQLIADPNKAYDLSPEEVVEVRKFINPYGNIVSAAESCINISIINWRDEYMRKFHMMGLVGYLYRTLEEYEPEEDIERVNRKWNKKIEATNAQITELREHLCELKRDSMGLEVVEKVERRIADLEATIPQMRTDRDEECKLVRRTAREVARRFLNRNFNYNPDKHLRGTHSSNTKDPERKSSGEVARDLMATGAKSTTVERKIKGNPDATYAYLKDKLLATYQSAIQTMETVKGTLKALQNPDNDLEDKMGILAKKHDQLVKITADMKKIVEPIAAADVLPAVEVEPPAEVLLQYGRYITNHYEQLREAYFNLHNEKPDIEFSVIYYDHFKNKDKARDHRVMHADEFKAEVLTLSNNGISMIGPFKENRERVDFYNKNTEIMRRMMEQMESDHKLGKDLMEKQVKAKKSKNIAEVGPDAPGLSAYAKTGTATMAGTVADTGARKILTKEDQDAMHQAELKRIQDEVPDEAIAVQMFYPETDENGETVLNKTVFHTQAEAPLHMQEGSAFTEKYQPKRDPTQTLSDTLTTRVVTDRHGNKVDIKDLSDMKSTDPTERKGKK